MPAATQQAPTTAERVRSVCVRATGAMLAVDGFAPVDTAVHHLLGDGAFAVAAGHGQRVWSPPSAARTALEAMLELTDHSPASAAQTGALTGVDPRPPSPGARVGSSAHCST